MDSQKKKKVKVSKEKEYSDDEVLTEKEVLEREFKQSSVPIAQLLKQIKEAQIAIRAQRMNASDLFTLATLQFAGRVYFSKSSDIVKSFKKMLKQQGYDKVEIQDEINAVQDQLNEIDKEPLS